MSVKSSHVVSFVVLVGLWGLVGLPQAQGDRRSDREIKRTMSQWARELGVKCDFCHVRQGRVFDYEAETHHKEVADYCHHHFQEPLRNEDGEQLSCSSCHDRDPHVFPAQEDGVSDAAHREVVAAYCEENFVGALFDADGDQVSCQTCHEDGPGKLLPEHDD